MPHSRRIFLVRTGLAAGGACLLPACFHAPAPFRFFTQAEADCLEALCECIIPGDDAPGAREAGVIYYIDRQLSGFFKKHQSAYRLGIQTLAGLVHGAVWQPLRGARRNRANRCAGAPGSRRCGTSGMAGDGRTPVFSAHSRPYHAGILRTAPARRQPRLCQLPHAGNRLSAGDRPQ
jgi:hypothetical protein